VTASAAVLRIDETCTACGLCLATCPEGALRVAPRRPRLVATRCTLCLACIEVCPVDAIWETCSETGSETGSDTCAGSEMAGP
jgi:ferredoxin